MEDRIFLKKIRIKKENNFFLNYLFPIEFKKPITVLTGENGVGKSAILESLAVFLGCPAEGGSKNFSFSTEDTHIKIPDLIFERNYRYPKDIFFYRSETFYTFMSEMKKLDKPEIGGGKINYFYGGKELHKLSHGEAMRALYLNKFKENGLYLLDEPEVSLSINNQLEFIEKIVNLSRKGSQFIIASHSPIIMQIPGIHLIEITKKGIKNISFKDTNIYYMYRELMLDESQEYLKSIINF